MQFLYPTSRQFPFDEVCSQIVSALQKRNWRVPDIKVTLHDYGSGEQKLRYVSEIEGAEFRIYFCRTQTLLPGGVLNDIAAANQIKIPKKLLHVYEDESGPSLWTYVGDDWDRDRDSFRADYNQKLDGRPRTYLRYAGASRWRGRRADQLRIKDDLREYEPQGDEPHQLRTADVLEEFRSYLHDVVLPAIEVHPVAAVPIDVFAVPAKIPFPANFGPFFTRVEYGDAARIKLGKRRDPDLVAAKRYAIAPNYRLTSLNVPDDGTVPKIAYEGFVWCGLDLAEVIRDGAPGDRSSYNRDFILRVTPLSANEVYVADHGVYERQRDDLSRAIKAAKEPRERFTEAEVNDFMRARARTIVPITAYAGGYVQPVVLINRELTFDEVEIISEPSRGSDEATGHT